MTSKSARLHSCLMVAPLFMFIGLFFLWPLGVMFKQSVSDSSAVSVFPITARAIDGWREGMAPTTEMKAAMGADLSNATDKNAVGELVRRLNSLQPGFRTLMAKTQNGLVEDPQKDISLIDARWNEPKYWDAIEESLSPLTDRYLLASVDLARNSSGEIVKQMNDRSANRVVTIRTFYIAGTTTIFCLLLGYPYALLLARCGSWKRNILLACVLLPLWTSLLVRTAAWFILLQDQGLINSFLVGTGLITSSVPLIFTRAGVIIAMTHVLLPFMVLPIYGVISTIPKQLVYASSSLGANPLFTFIHVLLPLSLRGIASGSLLVFMSAIGYYITPALIGGPKDQMISSVIAFYATQSANWSMASALGVLLMLVTLVFYSIYVWQSRDKVIR